MTHAIRMYETGGPEVLLWEKMPAPEPGPNTVAIEQEAIGLNFIDTHFRRGIFKIPLPATPGLEGAGTVVGLGAGVTSLAVGDRVAYASAPLGAYAKRRIMPADRLVKLPDTISFEAAAAMMLTGMTAYCLLHRVKRIGPEDRVLIHAAAGGVGLVLCRWARALGAHVIGVVSTEAKAELARSEGAETVVIGLADLAAQVKTATQGAMVSVVYDGVGRDSVAASLDCLAPLGMLVSHGAASGPPPPIDIPSLGAKGSLFVTRPSLSTYTARREWLTEAADAVFRVAQSGEVPFLIGQRFPLADAAAAHRAIEERTTVGSTILLP